MVRFENVGLRYGMGAEILKDISFVIGPQSFQFLTGPSGAGKTTLLRLILLSLRPTRGAIALFGTRRPGARQNRDHRIEAADRRRVSGFPAARPSDDL